MAAKKARAAKKPGGTKAKRKPAPKRAAAGKPPRKPAAKTARKAAPKRGAAARLPMPELLYSAKREADVVDVPERTVLSIIGEGGPDQEAFKRSIGALYGVAYTLRFSRKPRGKDFKVGPLAGRWWAEGAGTERSMVVAPRESWRWRLRIDVPGDVTERELFEVIHAATTRKGGKLEGSAEAGRVALERVPAQKMGRILHLGPYGEEPASFEKIRVALEAAGLRGGDAHHEIYLSDPMRTEPSKLKTVLLLELLG